MNQSITVAIPASANDDELRMAKNRLLNIHFIVVTWLRPPVMSAKAYDEFLIEIFKLRTKLTLAIYCKSDGTALVQNLSVLEGRVRQLLPDYIQR